MLVTTTATRAYGVPGCSIHVTKRYLKPNRFAASLSALPRTAERECSNLRQQQSGKQRHAENGVRTQQAKLPQLMVEDLALVLGKELIKG